MGYKQNTHHKQLPVAVETVLEFGYPSDEVKEVYRRMTSEKRTSSSSSADDVRGTTRRGEILLGATASSYSLAEDRPDLVSAKDLFEMMEKLYGLPVTESFGRKHGTESGSVLTGATTHEQSVSETENTAFLEEDGDRVAQHTAPPVENHSDTATSNHATSSADAAAANTTPTATEVNRDHQALPSSGPSASLEFSTEEEGAISNNPPTTPASAAATLTAAGADANNPDNQTEPRSVEHSASQEKENVPPPASNGSPSEQPASPDDEAEKRKRELRNRVRVLRAENRRLKQRQTCRNCQERPVSLTLLPCGHFCFCEECGSKFTSCPICRKTILADVRTFVS